MFLITLNVSAADEAKYIKSFTCSQTERIIESHGISQEKFKAFSAKNYQGNKLKSLEKIIPLSNLDKANSTQGSIKQITAVSHHIWITNMEQPRDIVVYESAEMREGKYKPKISKAEIDHKDNAFIQSITNLQNGAKSAKLPIDKFHHILWTNFSREDLVAHPELNSLRKICKIDRSSVKLPEFIVLNINDLIDGVDKIHNIADPKQEIPSSIKNRLNQLRQDIISVKPQIEDMLQNKKFAGVSDVLRIAVVKDIGGMYFDLDYNLFDQDKIHLIDKKYNLFDLMTNYETIVGKETSNNNRLCNAFIYANEPNRAVLEETWSIIKRNIITPDKVDYIKYSAHEAERIILQTGPIPLTIGFIKGEGDKDIAIDFGGLIYYDSNKKQEPYKVKMDGKVGAMGYDSWGGSWRNDYKSSWYLYYDLSTGEGITKAQWQKMNKS